MNTRWLISQSDSFFDCCDDRDSDDGDDKELR